METSEIRPDQQNTLVQLRRQFFHKQRQHLGVSVQANHPMTGLRQGYQYAAGTTAKLQDRSGMLGDQVEPKWQVLGIEAVVRVIQVCQHRLIFYEKSCPRRRQRVNN